MMRRPTGWWKWLIARRGTCDEEKTTRGRRPEGGLPQKSVSHGCGLAAPNQGRLLAGLGRLACRCRSLGFAAGRTRFLGWFALRAADDHSQNDRHGQGEQLLHVEILTRRSYWRRARTVPARLMMTRGSAKRRYSPFFQESRVAKSPAPPAGTKRRPAGVQSPRNPAET